MPAQKAKLTAYSPVRHLKGVGPQIEQRLAKLNIFTLQDLIFHFPLRYQNRTQPTAIDELAVDSEQLTTGTIQSVKTHPGRNRRSITTITLSDALADGQQSLSILLFNAPRQQLQRYTVGTHLLCFGTVKLYNHQFQMTHPDIEANSDGQFELPNELTPIYPTTQGLHQKTLHKLTKQLLALYQSGDCNFDLLPEDLYQNFGLQPLLNCLNNIHFPPADINPTPFRQQVGLEELLTHYLNILELRKKRENATAPPIKKELNLYKQLIEKLPFELTSGQISTINNIYDDLLSANTPMFRLVQGDVGCGKTVVAAITALMAAESGFQVALLAPTEILATQHFVNFCHWLEPFDDISVHLLLGKTSNRERQTLLDQLQNNPGQIVIGTHALYQQEIKFNRLGLVVIDEQHRFGVEQRQALLQKCSDTGFTPHQLILTATPIPRTLAMSLFDCIDCSTIETLPSIRKPISTAVIPDSKREALISRVQSACDQGQQVFWVCPNIHSKESSSDSSEEKQPRSSVEQIHQLLESRITNHNLCMVHGKMQSEEKQEAMSRFQNGKTSILIATTVIEVGVDIPNASIIIIENADLFGLAQLHQLRGRVGRGSRESYCLLLYSAPLNDSSHQRLETIRNCQSGFDIAEKDLEMRGSGELLGTEQAGITRFKVANISEDRNLLQKAKEIAHWLVKNSSDSFHYKLSQRWLYSPVNTSLS